MSNAKRRSFESHVIKPLLHHMAQATGTIQYPSLPGHTFVQFYVQQFDLVNLFHNLKHVELKTISPRYDEQIDCWVLGIRFLYKGQRASLSMIDNATDDQNPDTTIVCFAQAIAPKGFDYHLKDPNFDVKVRQATKHYLYGTYTEYTDNFINNDNDRFVPTKHFDLEDYPSQEAAFKDMADMINNNGD